MTRLFLDLFCDRSKNNYTATHGNWHGTTTQLWGAKTKHCCVAVPVKTTTLPNLDSENKRALETNGIHLQHR